MIDCNAFQARNVKPLDPQWSPTQERLLAAEARSSELALQNGNLDDMMGNALN